MDFFVGRVVKSPSDFRPARSRASLLPFACVARLRGVLAGCRAASPFLCLLLVPIRFVSLF